MMPLNHRATCALTVIAERCTELGIVRLIEKHTTHIGVGTLNLLRTRGLIDYTGADRPDAITLTRDGLALYRELTGAPEPHAEVVVSVVGAGAGETVLLRGRPLFDAVAEAARLDRAYGVREVALTVLYRTRPAG